MLGIAVILNFMRAYVEAIHFALANPARAQAILRAEFRGLDEAGAVATGKPPGRLRMSLSGTLAGGAVSLKTLRPVASTHCHCARAGRASRSPSRAVAVARQAREGGRVVSIGAV